MSAVAEAPRTGRWLPLFRELEAALPGGGRREAIAEFARAGFPTTAEERWRFTDLSPLAGGDFAPAAAGGLAEARALAEGALEVGGPRLAFVDGRFSAELSSLEDAAGWELSPFSKDWGRVSAAASKGPLAALNAAFLTDGALVRALSSPERPLQVLFLSTGRPAAGGAAPMAHTRLEVEVAAGARAALVEEHLGRGRYLASAFAAARLGEGAALEHYRVQRESEEAFHLGGLEVSLGAGARYLSHAVSMGGALSRLDLDALLGGPDAECALNGLYLARGGQHADHHTSIEHARERGTSRELYKGVLEGRARAVFDGGVLVREGAQATDAAVYNKNLLLSEAALVDTKPDFKIHANDVRCKHGATIGRLSEDALFYLRSRGIGREEARSLLVYAFASEMLERMGSASVREGLEALIHERLPG